MNTKLSYFPDDREATDANKRRDEQIVEYLPFVEIIAARVCKSSPINSVDIHDLVQDGVLGLIDALKNFDPARGVKFETYAQLRVKGAMIDGLRRSSWPRGLRKIRRLIEVARLQLRAEIGEEPSLKELAFKLGCTEKLLIERQARIVAVEAMALVWTKPENYVPQSLLPPPAPDPEKQYEEREHDARLRYAIGLLPVRERTIIRNYYYSDMLMSVIGKNLGVKESRVSQLHAKALRRLKIKLAELGQVTPIGPALPLLHLT